MFNWSFVTRSSDRWMLYANNLSNVQQLNTNLKQLIASPVFRKTNREEKCHSGDGCVPVGSSQQLYPPSTGADCKAKWMRAVDLRKGWRVNSMFRGGFCIKWRMLYWGWRWICIRNLTYGYEPCLVGSCNEQKADCVCSRASCEGLRSSAIQGPQRRAAAAPQTMVENLKNVILSLNKSLLCTCDRSHGCRWSRASASHIRQTLLTSGKKISTSDQRQPHRQNMRVWRIDFK